jgi:hypothetical protein
VKRSQTEKGGRVDSGALALRLFDQVFGPTWASWRAWLCAVLALPMAEAEADSYRACTARQTLPGAPAREAWCVVGRRGGKSRIAALIAVLLAAFRRYTLAPGERAVVLVIAADRKQARVVFGYTLALLQSIPALAELIVRQTADSIDLSTGVSIEIATASFRSPRGYTIVGAVLDEVAFLMSDDSANPDTEIVRAIRPALATVPGSLLVAISSPYAQRGELFKHFDKYYGRDGDVLVWQAETRAMNPTVPQAVVDRALEEDPAAASAEWLAQFRADLESLFAREALDAIVARGRFELPPQTGITYAAFVDPSGGSADSFTLAIAHRDASGAPVLDLLRERRPPFSPESVVAEYARDLKRYNVRIVTGDRYGGEWPREQFRKVAIDYQTAELTRSELYLELLPMVNSGSVALLDNARLLGQLAGLERRVGRAGRDSVDHRPGAHDDAANAAAGAIAYALRSIGLATLPDTFRTCYRASSFRSFNMPDCYLFGGRFRPPGDACCRACIGHQFVLAARRADQERTGEATDLITFYNSQIVGNDFTAVIRANRWAGDVGL